jgi:uncharacterized protein YbjT (DUF2867 family)
MVTMSKTQPTIAVLGASGLIGQAVADNLIRQGFSVTPITRRFTTAQRSGFGTTAIESSFVDLDVASLATLISDANADLVVNCVGILQDGAHGQASDVHQGFVARLIDAIAAQPRPPLLIHLSIPGAPDDDKTVFSQTKRDAERTILTSNAPFIIIRPGFVIAPTAYGGSALIRALAALPVNLPAAERDRPFAATAVSDISATIVHAATAWRAGKTDFRAIWDVMESKPSTVGDVISAFRHHFGGPDPVLAFPGWLLAFGARCADIAGRLGWSPPIRTTALAEMQRGVAGDPAGWIAATGLSPKPLDAAVAMLPATIQERWFARLYLAKALAIGTLSAFWIASGLIAMTVGFAAATRVLTSHGVGDEFAKVLVAVTSTLDILIGILIAIRRSCQIGLLAGIAVSLAYIASATLLAPDLWADPTGPLVKVGPAIALTLVNLAIIDNR